MTSDRPPDPPQIQVPSDHSSTTSPQGDELHSLVESPWSNLHEDLLETIFARLNVEEDVGPHSLPNIHNLRLRSVCKSWRSSIPPSPPNPPHTELPFPIAPTCDLNPSLCGHFNLSRTTTYLLQQPPLQQSSSSSSTSPKYWLLRVKVGSSNHSWSPLNPLSELLTYNNVNIPIEFPNEINLLDFRVSKVATSYILDFVDCNETSIKIKNDYVDKPGKVAVSKSGVLVVDGFKLAFLNFGKFWKFVDFESDYKDVILFKQKFVAVGISGRAVSIDCTNLTISVIATSLQRDNHIKKLVVSDGELFLFVKQDKIIPSNENVMVEIFRLNEERKVWEGVNNLGDRSFFVGEDCSFPISTRSFPGMKSNCVYFCGYAFYEENVYKEKLGVFVGDTGVFCLADGRGGALGNMRDHLPLFWPPPSWLNLQKNEVPVDDHKESEAISEPSKAIAFKPDLQLVHLRTAFQDSMSDSTSMLRDCEAALCLDPTHSETLELYHRGRELAKKE